MLGDALLLGERNERLVPQVVHALDAFRITQPLQESHGEVMCTPGVESGQLVLMRPAVAHDAQFIPKRTDKAGAIIEGIAEAPRRSVWRGRASPDDPGEWERAVGACVPAGYDCIGSLAAAESHE